MEWGLQFPKGRSVQEDRFSQRDAPGEWPGEFLQCKLYWKCGAVKGHS